MHARLRHRLRAKATPARGGICSTPSSTAARALFWKYWWLVLFTTCAGLAISAWKVAHQSTVFVSTGRMMVSGKINLTEGATYSEEMNFFMTTQRELMQDAAVRERAEARVRTISPETPVSPVEFDGHAAAADLHLHPHGHRAGAAFSAIVSRTRSCRNTSARAGNCAPRKARMWRPRSATKSSGSKSR